MLSLALVKSCWLFSLPKTILDLCRFLKYVGEANNTNVVAKKGNFINRRLSVVFMLANGGTILVSCSLDRDKMKQLKENLLKGQGLMAPNRTCTTINYFYL